MRWDIVVAIPIALAIVWWGHHSRVGMIVLGVICMGWPIYGLFFRWMEDRRRLKRYMGGKED